MSTAELVRRSLANIDPQQFEQTLKSKLFERDPALLKTIVAASGAEDPAWLARFVEALTALEDKRRLEVLAATLAGRHGHARIQPRAYTVIGQALIDTMQALLGPAFCGDLRDAYAQAYVEIAEAVMAARYNHMDLVA